MTHHTEPRRPHEPRRGRFPRVLTSRQVRAVLCLGIFAAPAAVGTMAYWSADATIPPSVFTAGTLDLTVGPTLEDSSRLPGTGGTTAYSALNIAGMLPGESFARPFVVRNNGTTKFTYNGSVSTSDNTLLAEGSGLRVGIYLGGSPTNTGTEGTTNRVGTCTGALLLDQAVSAQTSTVDVSPTDLPLTRNDTDVYCVRVLLHPESPGSFQGMGTSLIIKLNAIQVGGP